MPLSHRYSRPREGLAVLLGALMAVTRVVAATPADVPAMLYASLPGVADFTIAPDGRHAAGLLRDDGGYVIAVFDLDAPSGPPALFEARDASVEWLAWNGSDLLLAGLSARVANGGFGLRAARVIALGTAGRLRRELPAPRDEDWLLQRVDLVDVLPADPGHVLLALTSADRGRPRVYRVDVATGKRRLVQGTHPGVTTWLTDSGGRVRAGHGIHAAGVSRRTFVRGPGGGAFRLLQEDPLTPGRVFTPVLFDAEDPDVLLVRSNHEGTAGLYRYDLRTRRFREALFRDPLVDIGRVVTDGSGRQVLGVEYDRDVRRSHWFDPRAAALADRLRAESGADDVRLVAVSDDLRRVIAFVASTDRPGRYVVAGPGEPVRELARDYPGLDRLALAAVRPVTFSARDGLRIPGYLTLPPGIGARPVQPLPAVVLPHGGPESRDVAEFSPLVQLLAGRGYAVLQVNFRGSAGYGAAFEQAGRREWGGAMQDDVTDGTRWLVAEGIADPERLCIVGWSYGGYAALMGLVREPGLYRCAASIAGISDLRRLARANSMSYLSARMTAARIGRPWRDGPQLAAASPLQRAGAITAPVLLVHGDRDPVVDVDQSRAMERALAGAGRPVTYVEIAGGNHALAARDHRRQLFETLDRFLREHLGAGG
jgi:dipeptidyl aminopeptidase/acylaminoacyl peptidase